MIVAMKYKNGDVVTYSESAHFTNVNYLSNTKCQSQAFFLVEVV